MEGQNLAPAPNPMNVQPQFVAGQVVYPGQVTFIPAPVKKKSNQQQYLRTLGNLGVVELLTGIISIILGIIIAVTAQNRPGAPYFHHSYFSSGEGIWTGFWLVISGGLGARFGKPNPSSCLLNSRMGFGIVASIISAVGLGVSVVGATVNARYSSMLVIMFVLLAIVLLVALSLAIKSSTLCYKINGICCNTRHPQDGQNQQHHQMVYSPQQPYNPGYVMQGYQPMQPGQPIQFMQPIQLMQPGQPMQAGQPIQPGQSIQLGQSMQPGQPLQLIQPGQQMQSTQTMNPTQQPQLMQYLQPFPIMQAASSSSNQSVLQQSNAVENPNSQVASTLEQKQEEATSNDLTVDISDPPPPQYEQLS